MDNIEVNCLRTLLQLTTGVGSSLGGPLCAGRLSSLGQFTNQKPQVSRGRPAICPTSSAHWSSPPPQVPTSEHLTVKAPAVRPSSTSSTHRKRPGSRGGEDGTNFHPAHHPPLPQQKSNHPPHTLSITHHPTSSHLHGTQALLLSTALEALALATDHVLFPSLILKMREIVSPPTDAQRVPRGAPDLPRRRASSNNIPARHTTHNSRWIKNVLTMDFFVLML